MAAYPFIISGTGIYGKKCHQDQSSYTTTRCCCYLIRFSFCLLNLSNVSYLFALNQIFSSIRHPIMLKCKVYVPTKDDQSTPVAPLKQFREMAARQMKETGPSLSHMSIGPQKPQSCPMYKRCLQLQTSILLPLQNRLRLISKQCIPLSSYRLAINCSCTLLLEKSFSSGFDKSCQGLVCFIILIGL